MNLKSAHNKWMAQDSNSFFTKITYTDGIYPVLKAEPIQNPNRFFATPVLGFLIKMIILLPVYIEMIFIGIWWLIAVVIINPFVVLITGKYWLAAHSVSLGFLRLSLKTQFYLMGLTNKYPGFDLNLKDNFSFDLPYPEKPNKFFAIPILGGLVRIILIIPYYFYMGIIGQAGAIGALYLAWAVVLFKGRYPTGIFELARDSMRVSGAYVTFLIGLSDRYPSFYISMAHDKIKIILIAISIILSGFNFTNNRFPSYYPVPDKKFESSEPVKSSQEVEDFLNDYSLEN